VHTVDVTGIPFDRICPSRYRRAGIDGTHTSLFAILHFEVIVRGLRHVRAAGSEAKKCKAE
jgi:hypothetical protein